MAPREAPADVASDELRAFGLTYPGAHTKSPWPGHLDLAVNDKTFAYLSVKGDPFSISCKLPHSCEDALSLPFVTPTAYGLGKSGWVTAQPEGPVPVELFKAWIDESYRAQAPKRLVAALAAGGAAASAAPSSATRRSAASRAAVSPAAASPAAVSPAAVSPAAVSKTRTAKKRTGKKPAAKSRASAAAPARAARVSKPGVKRARAKPARAVAKPARAVAKPARAVAKPAARSRRAG